MDTITVGNVFTAAATLISDPTLGDTDQYAQEFDRGVTELVCTLVGLTSDDKAAVLAYLRSVQAYENDKARIDSLIYRRNN